MNNNCMQLGIYINTYSNFEASFVRASKVQRSSTFHKRKNMHLRDRYSAVRLISNCIKLRDQTAQSCAQWRYKYNYYSL